MLLLVEPYADLREGILQQLFSGDTPQKTISDRFFYAIAEHIHYKKDLFIDMLKPSQAQLEEKTTREAPCKSCKEFMCVLQCWRGDSGTYQSLHEGDTGPVQCVCWKEPSGEFHVQLKHY